MMSRRTVCMPVVLSLAITCAMGIMLLGGCPQQQVPTTPTTQEPNSTTNTPTDTDTGQPERPIPGPVIDANEPDTGGDTGTDGTDGGDGGNDGTSGGGGTGTAAFSVRFDSPLTAVAVRPTARINLGFRLTDRESVVTQVEFVLARDDNGDGKPDGVPVLAKSITSTIASGAYAFSAADAPLSNTGVGRFLLGLRLTPSTGAVQTSYATGIVTIDKTPPSVKWITPTENKLTSLTSWPIQIQTSDNSAHTVRVVLDNDSTPNNGYAGILVADTEFPANDASHPDGVIHTFTPTLSISAGTYYYYVIVSDNIDPATTAYASVTVAGGGTKLLQLMVTNRLVGRFDLNRLDPDSPDADAPYDNGFGASKGAILQGFNFNDLAGASLTHVPDLNGDGADELVVTSRFGKPHFINDSGVGWGEAYMLLGRPGVRLREPLRLNAVGTENVPGLVFTGIRAPKFQGWTEGISDVSFVPDMDADGRPDLVFSFPRVESISLANRVWQYPELFAYEPSMGSLEYDPFEDVADTVDLVDPNNPGEYAVERANYEIPLGGATWLKNRTQFTRGGVVIVSSNNQMFAHEAQLNALGHRIIDLHETGQIFGGMLRLETRPIIENSFTETETEDCNDTATEFSANLLEWDLIFKDQGQGGFSNWLTDRNWWDPRNPPAANMIRGDWSLGRIGTDYVEAIADPCGDKCVVINSWLPYTPCSPYHDTHTASLYFPPGDNPEFANGLYIYTGFYGRGDARVAPRYDTVGARLLGQRVDDRFGTAVSADGSWLYVSAPMHTALAQDVPDLGAEQTRERSGVVYLFQTNSPAQVGGPTRSQLWIEYGFHDILDPNNAQADPNDPNDYISVRFAWPNPDVQREDHTDYDMPVPHTYVVKELGWQRPFDDFWEEEWTRSFGTVPFVEGKRFATYPLNLPAGCVAGQAKLTTVEGGVRTSSCEVTRPAVGGVGTSRWYVGRAAQLVGPHADAQISNVRSVGDIDHDNNPDVAVGSPFIRSNIVAGTGQSVGALFILPGRLLGLEGSYLLERMAYETTDTARLAGVVVKGNSQSEPFAQVFDGAGDFNGDGFDDVLAGSPNGSGGNGEVIVVFGSPYLQSPGGGWTVDQAVQVGAALRFVGESIGDAAGTNVAGAGDVDGDGLGDILIAAPSAEGGRGAVYLVYGSQRYVGGDAIELSKIGTFDLPGAKFIGRAVDDALGGGKLTYGDKTPANSNANIFLNPDENRVDILSRGVFGVGDLDNDGKADIALSSMLADPLGRRDAGEVYVIYGSGD